MLRSQPLAVALAAAALASPALADPTVIYTSEAAFLAKLHIGSTETFTGVPESAPSSYPNGGFAFGLSAPGGLFGNASGSVGTNFSDEDLTISLGGLSAVGGYFYATDFDGTFQPTIVTLTLSDGTVESFVSNSLAQSFRGFVSDNGYTSLSVSAFPGVLLGAYATVDNITVGIPEPASWGLAGLALVGLRASRRRPS